MADMSTTSPRPMLAAVDNIVASRSSLEDEQRGSPGKAVRSPAPDSNSSDSSSPSSSTLAKDDKATSPQSALAQPQAIRSSSSASIYGRPSSVASSGSAGAPLIAAASSSHSNLSASLLTPTLASALGITPSAWRKRNAYNKQHTSPLPPSTSSITLATTSTGQAWSRRPSLPSLSSGNDRMSMYSVASFDSLPEGETSSVTNAASSPKAQAIDFPSGSHSYESDALRRTTSQTRRRIARTERRDKSPAGDAKDPIWAKRRNVARELLETEKAFVQSLRIINDHYYQPLLALSRGQSPESAVKLPSNARPTLSRKAINEIFSNFGDILHLNSELLVRLEERLSGQNRDPPNSRPVSMVLPISEGDAADTSPPVLVPWDAQQDLIGDLLAPMAPFFKMYSFYVKNFSSALTRIEGERKANETFARFLKETERITWMTTSGGRTEGFGFGLGLQAHLLTIVQRIPRYKLLVGELVKCTPALHKDHADLCRAYRVIEQVAETINDNIRQHEMVLSMLNIQRLLVGMPVPLIVPGRTLLKRATLLKAGRKDIHAREFFLFTDCVIYAAPPAGPMVDATAAWQAFSRYGAGAADGSSSPVASPIIGKAVAQIQVRPASPDKRLSHLRRRTTSVPTHIDPKRVSFTTLEGQQLQYRGKFALQDCTVVGVEDATWNDPSLRHCFEIRTPGKSFAVYAESYEAKQEWLTSIRTAREELMSNRRTLQAEEDSILAKRDRRRSLQAFNKGIAFPRTDGSPNTIPEGSTVDESALRKEEGRSRRESFPASLSTAASLAAYLGGSSIGDQSSSSVAGSASGAASRGSLKLLEDYNAPVWVPDSRADKCACCSESFGLWRRKHHCRLCGQVVCWSCSQRSFLIAGDDEGEQDRPARACDPCYESVFPDTPEPSIAGGGADGAQGGMSRSSKAFDSDVSLPSCPPTPPIGAEATTQSTNALMGEGSAAPRIEVCNEEHARECDDASMPLPQMRRNRSFSPPFGHIGSGAVESSAPATRIAKAHALEARLFNGQMLSPQVHAATSGSGTFRLVTPRLTTPEDERPPYTRAAKSHGGRLGSGGDGDVPHDALDTPSALYASAGATPAEHGADGGDYFSGVNAANNFSAAVPFPSFLAPRRRKPMSAAARLSSVYGALPPSTPSSNVPQT